MLFPNLSFLSLKIHLFYFYSIFIHSTQPTNQPTNQPTQPKSNFFILTIRRTFNIFITMSLSWSSPSSLFWCHLTDDDKQKQNMFEHGMNFVLAKIYRINERILLLPPTIITVTTTIIIKVCCCCLLMMLTKSTNNNDDDDIILMISISDHHYYWKKR